MPGQGSWHAMDQATRTRLLRTDSRCRPGRTVGTIRAPGALVVTVNVVNERLPRRRPGTVATSATTRDSSRRSLAYRARTVRPSAIQARWASRWSGGTVRCAARRSRASLVGCRVGDRDGAEPAPQDQVVDRLDRAGASIRSTDRSPGESMGRRSERGARRRRFLASAPPTAASASRRPTVPHRSRTCSPQDRRFTGEGPAAVCW